LGACTAITLRMYADRKKWPLDAVEVRLHHAKVHAGEGAASEKDSGKIDYFDIVIGLRGALDAEQRRRLVEIAGKCPVHKTLLKEVMITTRLEEP
jgi:putative redox protein